LKRGIHSRKEKRETKEEAKKKRRTREEKRKNAEIFNFNLLNEIHKVLIYLLFLIFKFYNLDQNLT
jgi:hypothetical protein